jgi:hypothetical protein
LEAHAWLVVLPAAVLPACRPSYAAAGPLPGPYWALSARDEVIRRISSCMKGLCVWRAPVLLSCCAKYSRK